MWGSMILTTLFFLSFFGGRLIDLLRTLGITCKHRVTNDIIKQLSRVGTVRVSPNKRYVLIEFGIVS